MKSFSPLKMTYLLFYLQDHTFRDMVMRLCLPLKHSFQPQTECLTSGLQMQLTQRVAQFEEVEVK